MKNSKFSRKPTPWTYILTMFLASRLLIYFVSYIGYHTITINYLPNLSSEINTYSQGIWYGLLARWDTNWYLFIADKGYTGILWAFFPLYPLSIRALNALPFDRLLTMTILSNLLFFGILWLIYRIVVEEWDDKDLARNVILATCFFPLSFFFSAPYTEAMSVFLLLSSFYLAKKGWWLGSFLSAMLASATRVTGILIGILLIGEFYRQMVLGKVKIAKVFGFMLVPLGVIAYMIFLDDKAGNPLAFLNAQKAWMREPSLGNLWFFDNPGTALEKVFTVFYLILVISLSIIRRWALAIYSFMFLLIPLSTGTFMSMPRLGMNAFPVFIACGMALGKNSNRKVILLCLSSGFMVYFTLLFTLWYWVS